MTVAVSGELVNFSVNRRPDMAAICALLLSSIEDVAPSNGPTTTFALLIWPDAPPPPEINDTGPSDRQ